MNRFCYTLCFLMLLPIVSLASPLFTDSNHKQLPVNKAFSLSLNVASNKQVVAHWDIAPDYALYQNRIHIKALRDSSAKIGTPLIPRNDAIKQGTVDGEAAFFSYANAYIPINTFGNGHLTLSIQYQGCKPNAYCYPPVHKLADINLTTGHITLHRTNTIPVATPVFQQGFLLALLSFLGLGILLSFTPCVLPMLPILWRIIIGKDHTLLHSLIHGAVYAISMAITFTILGFIAASIGHSLAALFQNVWMISIFCLIILIMALSQFDLIHLSTPQSLDRAFQTFSGHQKAGSFLAAILLGIFSSLILSPCISAPLIAILLYIANQGNVWLGGASLFALAIGMNLPLLAVALLGKKILPKTGAWMNSIKHLSAFVLLYMACWLLSRVVPGNISLLLYGIITALLSLYWFKIKIQHQAFRLLSRVLSLIFMLYTIALFAGSIMGHNNPLHPLSCEEQHAQMQTITSKKALRAALMRARKNAQPVLIDFYASWCTACQTMDRTVFNTPQVQKALRPFKQLRVDLSQNTPQTLAIAKAYGVFAPPSLVFYNTAGKKSPNKQIFGEASRAQVLSTIAQID